MVQLLLNQPHVVVHYYIKQVSGWGIVPPSSDAYLHKTLQHPNHTPIPLQPKMTLTKLNFITGNQGKLREVRAILGNVIEVDNQEVDVPEIQGSIEEIAKEKARRAAEAVIAPEFSFYLRYIY